MKLHDLTIDQAHRGLAAGEFSAVDLTTDCLERIRRTDGEIHAFLTVDEEGALAYAAAADKKIATGEATPLTGIPVAIKDVISTAGLRTTAASKMLEHFVPAYDATVVARLKHAGAVVIGKTNLDEFAHGASTEYSAFGVTKNPWDTSRVAGGSSGGSAAAVAAGQVLAALGSDTGGSIRHPAAFCGVVGLKPTYGRVSRYGLLSMTSSTDVIGSLTKTVADAAVVLGSMAGHDNADATSARQPLADYAAAAGQTDLTGVRIGLPKEFFSGELSVPIREQLEVAVAKLEELGGRLVKVSLPHALLSLPTYYVLTPSEVSANLARYDGLRFGYHTATARTIFEQYAHNRGESLGSETKRRIMTGTYALSVGHGGAHYRLAEQVRTIIRHEAAAVLEKVDVFVGPTTAGTAFTIGARQNDPVAMYLEDFFLAFANIAGLPAMSVPCGFIDHLPVGLQLIGKWFDEATLFTIGGAYQQVTDWHESRAVTD